MEILEDFEKFREDKKELASLVTATKTPEYDRSRRAFELGEMTPAEKVVEQVEERVLRELAQRLTGIASPHRPAHVQAVADGHYAKLADISLSVSNQSYLDRSVIDAIGLSNASMVMRHAMEADGHDPKAMLQALEQHHLKEQKKLYAALDRYDQALELDSGLVEAKQARRRASDVSSTRHQGELAV